LKQNKTSNVGTA